MKTTREIYNFCTKVLEYKKPFLVVAFTFLCSLAAAAHNENSAGSVSFVIGKAYLSNPALNKKRIRVNNNTPIFEGDQITTANGGHVHIRFIDDGMVSIRPNSVMSIDYYQYDSASPKNSVIRFELSKGVARSISGKGAKAARDKFRLNTPIAAIGVRGTDFVISAKENLIQAVVNEGAIVVAPFSSHCISSSFGPCETNSVELNDLSKHLIEFSSQTNKPILIPLENKFIPELMFHQSSKKTEEKKSRLTSENQTDTQNNDGTSSEENSSDTNTENSKEDSSLSSNGEHDSNQNTTETNDSDISPTEKSDSETNAKEEVHETQAPKTDVTLTTTDTAGSLPDQTDKKIKKIIDEAVPEKPIVPKPDNFVPQVAVPLDELQNRQLAWGRWSSRIETGDRIISDRSDIIDGRSAAVSSKDYVLYRSDNDSNLQTVDPSLESIEFNLVDAQAVINTPLGKELVAVKDGWLNIDFSKNTFNTGLFLNHRLINETALKTSGSINDKGFFNSRQTDTTVIGASTLDGTEASYLFFKDTQAGQIEGVTFWDNKP